MMAEMDAQGADVVYAVSRARAGETHFKKATARLFYRLLSRLTDVEIPLDAGDFRLTSRRALDGLLRLPEQARSIPGWVPREDGQWPRRERGGWYGWNSG